MGPCRLNSSLQQGSRQALSPGRFLSRSQFSILILQCAPQTSLQERTVHKARAAGRHFTSETHRLPDTQLFSVLVCQWHVNHSCIINSLISRQSSHALTEVF